MKYPHYSVAIRTLGKSGILLDTLIMSLKKQTCQPNKIIIYIAEGYPCPQKVADEIYVYCPKGMAHQRSLDFEEIDDEYILLCDDDIFLKPTAVQKLFDGLLDNDGDCISPNVFPNHEMRFRTKCLNAAFYGTFPSFSNKYAFKIRKSSYYSYANSPKTIMEAQSCAGPCMLVKKAVNNSLNYKDENWLDTFPYTSGQDQIFAYKLYRYGYKLLIHYDSGVTHLDAQTGHIKDVIQADFNKRMIRYIEWYRSIYEPSSQIERIYAIISYYTYWTWLYLLAIISKLIGRNMYKMSNSTKALKAAKKYVASKEFQNIPKWHVKR